MPAVLQHEWDLYHATWFTLMGVGGGVFLVTRLLGLERETGVWLGLPVVDLVSFVVISVGGVILLWSLGRPLRFLRAALRPHTSWISRGALADFVFLVAGGALVLPGLTVGGSAPFAWLPWDPWATTRLGKGIEIAALLSSAIVIVYAGLVLADKAAVPFWRSAAVPTEFMLSSLAMSVPTAMTLQAIYGTPIDARPCWLLAALLALLLPTIVWHLCTGRETPGKTESLQRLATKYGPLFYAGVLGAGTVLPMLLAVLAAVAPATRGAIGIACLALTVAGGFVLRLVWLRVGYFPPISGAIRPLRR